MAPSTEHFNIGVLLLPPVQLLDAAPADLFGMLTKAYLDECGLPSPITKLGIDATVHWIAPSGSLAECTGDAALRTTADLESAGVQAGQLDALLIPGPPPSYEPNEAEKAFVRSHAASKSTDVLTICTGAFVAAHSGIFDGRTVTAPRALIPDMRNKFPAVTFDDARRWVRDGNLWSSGGITNGQEMVAAYIRARWPVPLAEAVCAMAEVGDKPVLYDSSTTAQGGWFVWLIFRALFVGRRVK